MFPTMDFDASPSLPAAPPLIPGGQCSFWLGLGFWLASGFLRVACGYVIFMSVSVRMVILQIGVVFMYGSRVAI